MSQNNKYNKLYIIGTAVLAVIFLILLATGKFDGFFENDESGLSSGYSDSLSSEDGAQSDESSVSEISDTSSETGDSSAEDSGYRFRNRSLLEQHYEKHGIDMGFSSAEEYELAAARVPSDPEVLHKTEAEDGDDVYYIERTNEFVIVSTDGYIRTYFNPDRGLEYFNRQ